MAIKLNTGRVSFPIEFDNGTKDVIMFNPNDPNLVSRLKDLQSNIMNKLDVLENKNEQEYDVIETFEEIEKALCVELDKAFGGNVSEIIFRFCSPFAITNGVFFFVQFFEAIIPEIEKCIKKSASEVQKKMEKHIAKYSK